MKRERVRKGEGWGGEERGGKERKGEDSMEESEERKKGGGE